MPIYAYRCDQCGARKDVLQKVSDSPLTRCTECGAEAFHKELTAPAFQLKGTGWYATDFRDNGKAKDKPADAAPKEGAAQTDSTPAPSAGAEAKPSAAPEAPASGSTAAPTTPAAAG